MLSQWSAWTDTDGAFSGLSGVWTLTIVDLTAYSDEIVRIAFYHVGLSTGRAGWYVDEIEIPGTPKPPRMQISVQDFEDGQGDWFADNGLWEVGTPTNVGPAACHQGSQCAGTVLDGIYPSGSSRLVSPPLQLNRGTVLDPLTLRFWHFFAWSGSSRGVVQISVWDEVLSQWSAWTDTHGAFSGLSGVWTLTIVDLTAYSDEIVRIAFYHVGLSTGRAGWYVDEIQIAAPRIFADGFESGDVSAWSKTVR